MNDDGLQAIFDAAFRHGSESEPDHECGDLQDCLREAWYCLSDAGREKLMTSTTVIDLLDRWGEEPYDEEDEEEEE